MKKTSQGVCVTKYKCVANGVRCKRYHSKKNIQAWLNFIENLFKVLLTQNMVVAVSCTGAFFSLAGTDTLVIVNGDVNNFKY